MIKLVMSTQSIDGVSPHIQRCANCHVVVCIYNDAELPMCCPACGTTKSIEVPDA